MFPARSYSRPNMEVAAGAANARLRIDRKLYGMSFSGCISSKSDAASPDRRGYGWCCADDAADAVPMVAQPAAVDSTSHADGHRAAQGVTIGVIAEPCDESPGIGGEA